MRCTAPVNRRPWSGIWWASAAALIAAAGAAEGRKVTFEDDVLPIFRDHCLKCHNPDKLKGDLDLTSFSAAIKGGGSGATLSAGDPDGSVLLKAITQAEEPAMPPNAKLSDRDIAIVRRWIEGGLLQGANSKAIAAGKPAVDLVLKPVTLGRPVGPPPLPGALPLEPVVVASRRPAITALAHNPWAPVVAVNGAHQVVVHRTDQMEFAGVLAFPEGALCDLKFSRDGRLLLAGGGRGGQSGVVAVWDITTGARVITIGDQYDSVLAADLSSDQQWIALGGADRVLKIYRARDGGLEHRIKKHTEWITAIEYSPDSKYLATGDRNGGLVLWETATGQELFALAGHRGGITAVTWRGDSTVLLSASEDGTLKQWKAGDGAALRSVSAHPGGALAARFTHDGRVVSSGRDNKVQVWDANGKNLRTLPFAGDLPSRVAFSDDGGKVIAGDWAGNVHVWDATTGRPVDELESNPPALARRLRDCRARLESREAAAAQARAAVERCAAELQRAQDSAARKKAAVDGPPSEPAAKVAARKQDSDAAAKAVAAATKRLAEAEGQAAEATARLDRAKQSLAHWSGILSASPGPAKSGSRAAAPTRLGMGPG